MGHNPQQPHELLLIVIPIG